MESNLKINWKFLTTTRGILLIVGVILFTFTAGAIGLIVFFSQQIGSSDVESDVPPPPVREMLELAFDEKKALHLGRAEMALFEAFTQGLTKNDYKKAHAYMTDCVDESVEAVGESSLITAMFLDIQGDIERHFEKWPVVESIERRLLKALPNVAQNQNLRSRARRHLAEALEKQNHYDAAVKVYAENVAIAEQIDEQKHSKTHSRTERALWPLARCYESNYDFNQAFAVNEKLLALVSKRPDSGSEQSSIVCFQGRLRRQQHHNEEALQLFNRAVELDNSMPYHFICRGLLFEDQQNYKAALSDLDRALAMAENISWYYDRRARVRTAAGHLDEAIADATQSIKLDAKSGDGYLMRGDAEVKANLNVEALADYNMAFKLGSDFAPAIARRAALFEKIGEHKKAIADATLVLGPGRLNSSRHFEDDYKISTAAGRIPLTVFAYQTRSQAHKALKQETQSGLDAAAAKKCEQQWRQFVASL